MFEGFFGGRKAGKREKSASHSRRLGFESLENRDMFAAEILVNHLTGITTEQRGSDSFLVTLSEAPTATVKLNVASSDTTFGKVSPSVLTFTTANWNKPHLLKVIGQPDKIPGSQQYQVGGVASSTDLNYNALVMPNLQLTNLDRAGKLTVTSTRTTTEEGGSALLTLKLNFTPTSDVTINLHSDNPTEGVPEVNQVVFLANSSELTKVVKVVGQPDGVKDRSQKYKIKFEAAVSDDIHFSGLTLKDVTLTNLDKVAAIKVTAARSLKTTEFGGTTQFSVVLTQQPNAPGAVVVVPIQSSDPATGVVDKNQLEFNFQNWNVPQIVTITGLDDGRLLAKDVKYTVVTGVAQSSDPKYAGLNSPDVAITNVRRTDVGRFDGHYEGDFSGVIAVPYYARLPFEGHLNMHIQNGVVTATLQINDYGEFYGNITVAGAGTIDKNGKLTFTFDENSEDLSGLGLKRAVVVGATITGLPTLKGKSTISVPYTYGQYRYYVTINLDLDINHSPIVV